MLFKNRVGALTPLDFHQLRKMSEADIKKVTLELSRFDYSAKELEEMLSINPLQPIAVRLPSIFHLGYQAIDFTSLEKLMDCLSTAFSGQKIAVILETTTVALGEIFDYFETKPGDFKALYDFKEVWVSHIIEACRKIKEMAEPKGLDLLIENAPMGGVHFFEPGHERIYPALRTPRHLLKICELTGVNLCFHTGNARISTNALQYMKRSRSVFAAATEEEILNSPSDWLDYYEQIAPHVKLIHLSDSLSWGDTLHSNHIPFRQEHIHELLKFANLISESDTPIILHLRQHESNKNEDYLTQMLTTLKQLRIG
jgi:hypothetical protein